MPHGEHTAIDYYPRRLYQAEIQNPRTVFHSFFDACSLPHAIEFIDSWLNVLNKNHYWKKGYPARLLFFYETLERLIEAAYLVNKMDNQNSAAVLTKVNEEQEIDFMNQKDYCGHQTTNTAWDYFPRSLTKDQFINPYIVFKKFFKYQKLPVWRDQLYDQLYTAFISKNKLSMEEYDLLATQKHLKRLVEAAHLVEVRTSLKENNGISEFLR